MISETLRANLWWLISSQSISSAAGLLGCCQCSLGQARMTDPVTGSWALKACRVVWRMRAEFCILTPQRGLGWTYCWLWQKDYTRSDSLQRTGEPGCSWVWVPSMNPVHSWNMKHAGMEDGDSAWWIIFSFSLRDVLMCGRMSCRMIRQLPCLETRGLCFCVGFRPNPWNIFTDHAPPDGHSMFWWQVSPAEPCSTAGSHQFTKTSDAQWRR